MLSAGKDKIIKGFNLDNAKILPEDFHNCSNTLNENNVDDATAQQHEQVNNFHVQNIDVSSETRDSYVDTNESTGGANISSQANYSTRPSLPLVLHEQPVLCCCISGSNLITGSADGSVRIWDCESLQLVASCRLHSSWVLCLSTHLSLPIIVTGSHDTTLFVFDQRTQQPIVNFCGHKDDITSCDISPDGKFVVSGSTDKTVKLWVIPDDDLGVSKTIVKATLNADCIQSDATATCFDDFLLWQNTDHNSPIIMCRFHLKSPVIISCDAAGIVQFNRVDTGQLVCTVISEQDCIRKATAFQFSSDCNFLAVGTPSGSLSMYRPPCVSLNELPFLSNDHFVYNNLQMFQLHDSCKTLGLCFGPAPNMDCRGTIITNNRLGSSSKNFPDIEIGKTWQRHFLRCC